MTNKMLNNLIKEASRNGYLEGSIRITVSADLRIEAAVKDSNGEEWYAAATEYGCVIHDGEDDPNYAEIAMINGLPA